VADGRPVPPALTAMPPVQLPAASCELLAIPVAASGGLLDPKQRMTSLVSHKTDQVITPVDPDLLTAHTHIASRLEYLPGSASYPA
jgi:hypothetical protein